MSQAEICILENCVFKNLVGSEEKIPEKKLKKILTWKNLEAS
jgi:hypothetical protein